MIHQVKKKTGVVAIDSIKYAIRAAHGDTDKAVQILRDHGNA
ncbi:MAG: hypothetical protein RR936_06920 [Carnobacterium sp.]